MISLRSNLHESPFQIVTLGGSFLLQTISVAALVRRYIEYRITTQKLLFCLPYCAALLFSYRCGRPNRLWVAWRTEQGRKSTGLERRARSGCYVIQMDDTVGPLYWIRSVRNYDRGDILQVNIKTIQQPLLGRRIKCGSTFIEDQDARVLK